MLHLETICEVLLFCTHWINPICKYYILEYDFRPHSHEHTVLCRGLWLLALHSELYTWESMQPSVIFNNMAAQNACAGKYSPLHGCTEQYPSLNEALGYINMNVRLCVQVLQTSAEPSSIVSWPCSLVWFVFMHAIAKVCTAGNDTMQADVTIQRSLAW